MISIRLPAPCLREVAQAGRADALRAIEAAHKARESWARVIVSERVAILLRVADIIAARVDEIREVLIEESGSTFGKAMFEVFIASTCCEARRVMRAIFSARRCRIA